MRILWLIKGLGAGGAERLLLTQAELSADDLEIVVGITRPDRSHLRQDFEALGIVIEDLSSSSGPGGWPAALARLIRSGDFDLVHVHSPALAPIARVLAKTTNLPVMSTEHNRWARHHPITRLANATTCRLDSHRIAVSEGVRLSMYRPFRGGVEVLHHGIDLSAVPSGNARAETREALGLEPATVCVIVVANLRPEKAPLDFVEAVRGLPHDVPARFFWVGQGPLEEDFVEAIAERGQTGRIEYLGYRTDVGELLAAADVFCLSSLHEGLPVAVMEAKAAGLPIVATSVGGIPEAVNTSPPSGVLVEPAQPHLLATALRQVIEDRALRAQLAEASAATAGVFDARRAVSRIEEIYRSLP